MNDKDFVNEQMRQRRRDEAFEKQPGGMLDPARDLPSNSSSPVIPLATNILRVVLFFLPLLLLGYSYANFSIIIYLLPEFFSGAVMSTILGCLGLVAFLGIAGVYYWSYYKFWRIDFYIWGVFISFAIFAAWVDPLIGHYRTFHATEADIGQCLVDDDMLASLNETQRQLVGLWRRELGSGTMEFCPDGTYLGDDKIKRSWWNFGNSFAIVGGFPVKLSVSEDKLVLAGQSYRRLTDDEKRQEQELVFLSAAARGQLDVVQQLLDQGIDVNTLNRRGETALIVAARRGQAEVVKALLAHEADVTRKDKQGMTALQWAIQGEHAGVVNILKTFGNNTEQSKKD